MKKIITSLLFIVLLFVIWSTPLSYPFKLITVFFHESSHVLASLLTGGEIYELKVNLSAGGHVISTGGSNFFVLSAGYLGSLFWGGGIYYLSTKKKWVHYSLMLIGSFVLLIMLFFMRDIVSMILGAVFGMSLIGAAFYLKPPYVYWVLPLIGLNSIIYAPLDIFSDTLSQSSGRSDAALLAEQYFGSEEMWGFIWISLSILIILFFFKRHLRELKKGIKSDVSETRDISPKA